MELTLNIMQREKMALVKEKHFYRIPISHKSIRLEGNPLNTAIDVLNAAAALAEKITAPISQITVIVQEVNQIVYKIENVIKSLNDIVSVANSLARIGYSLSPIPGVGSAASLLANGLSKFEATTKQFLHPLNEFKASVLDRVKAVMNNINDTTIKINDYVNYFTTK